MIKRRIKRAIDAGSGDNVNQGVVITGGHLKPPVNIESWQGVYSGNGNTDTCAVAGASCGMAYTMDNSLQVSLLFGNVVKNLIFLFSFLTCKLSSWVSFSIAQTLLLFFGDYLVRTFFTHIHHNAHGDCLNFCEMYAVCLEVP